MTDPRDNSDLPQTVAELEDARVDLIEEMNGIRNQLASRRAAMDVAAIESGDVDSYGKPMADRQKWSEYVTWRARATTALRHMEVELQDVNKTLREKRAERNALPPEINTRDPLHLLVALNGCAHRLATQVGRLGGAVESLDQAIMDAVRDGLQHKL